MVGRYRHFLPGCRRPGSESYGSDAGARDLIVPHLGCLTAANSRRTFRETLNRARTSNSGLNSHRFRDYDIAAYPVGFTDTVFLLRLYRSNRRKPGPNRRRMPSPERGVRHVCFPQRRGRGERQPKLPISRAVHVRDFNFLWSPGQSSKARKTTRREDRRSGEVKAATGLCSRARHQDAA